MKYRLSLFLAFNLILIFLSCDIFKLEDEGDVSIKVAESSAVVSLEFRNAANSELINWDIIHLTIEGGNQDMVVDMSGSSRNEFEVPRGLLTFGLQKGLNPSSASPIVLKCIAKSDVFIATSKNLVIDNTGGHLFTIFMTREWMPPEGVSEFEGNPGETTFTGQLKHEIVIQTPTSPTVNTTVEITIPQNTVITNSEGDTLRGSIHTRITYFSNESEESLRSFPGGFGVSVQADASGNPGRGWFVTGGFIAIDIKDSFGKKAENFSDSVKVTMELPGTTVNPATGSFIKNGDTVPIWSYDDDTAEWAFEANATVTGPNTNGNFEVTYYVTHFSWWNIDWYSDQICDESLVVQIQNQSLCNPCLWIDLYFHIGGSQIYYGWFNECNDWFGFTWIVPANVPATLVAYDWLGNRVGELYIENLCLEGSIVAWPINNQFSGVNPITFKIEVFCPSTPDNKVIPPDLPVYLADTGTHPEAPLHLIGWLDDGEITLCGFQVPGTYRVYTYYTAPDGSFYEFVTNFQIDANYTITDLGGSGNMFIAQQSGSTVTYEVELPGGSDLCP